MRRHKRSDMSSTKKKTQNCS